MTAYDKPDWHHEAAVRSGQPERNAFAHAAFYLAWLIERGLHDPQRFRPEHVAAVKSGEMSGSALLDEVDAKLLPQMMSPEGRAFSDARYGDYLAEYEATFADIPEYGVADDVAKLARIIPVIDRLYSDWVAQGRPALSPERAQDRRLAEAAEWQALSVGSDFDALRDPATRRERGPIGRHERTWVRYRGRERCRPIE
ncbi:MAG: hypothetical protein M3067_15375 [Chloroflexota bacterium]|nr:hypothetical protein [Chloroflexota bacterium]